MLKAVVIGLFQGSAYGLLAVGIVLVYKGARVFNFAQGEFGTVAAFVTWALFRNAHLPYLVAAVVGLAAAVLLGILVERAVVRPLLDAPRITLLVATVGVALFIIALTIVIAQPTFRTLDPLIQGGPVTIAGAGIARQQLLVAVALLALAVALALFFSRTDLGLAVLATSQDPLATRVVGISVEGMSRFIWAFAAFLGGVAGILQAPISPFFPGFMTIGALIPAFTGAVLGGMTSLPGAFVGGLLVGVAQNLGTHYLPASFPGGASFTVFCLLLAVLLVRPQGLLGKEA
jgi:branched-chain amino acid transport system permease protein